MQQAAAEFYKILNGCNISYLAIIWDTLIIPEDLSFEEAILVHTRNASVLVGEQVKQP